MMTRRVSKTYLAIVSPPPKPAAGVIDARLRRESVGREAYVRVAEDSDSEAQTARTQYRTLSHHPLAALVELRPATGRMHQLRVHLAWAGSPIAGDARYGGALTLGDRPAARLMLHAAELRFPHPAGEAVRVTAPPPPDFRQLLVGLGLSLPGLVSGDSHDGLREALPDGRAEA